MHAPGFAGLPVGLLDIGPIELMILAAAAVMLFGGDLPDMARRAGQVIGRLRASAQELTRDIEPPRDVAHLPKPGADRPPEKGGSSEPGDPHAPPPEQRPAEVRPDDASDPHADPHDDPHDEQRPGPTR
ncbi:MAG: Sec-independent protein translocase subunit TatA/TatB [Planctomycetota bacterium]